MKREEAMKLAENATDQLLAALERGHSDALTAYLATLGRFHNYSFGNVMLIAMQKPDATQVAGFTTWKKMNRFVRKGEKGIGIIAPMVGRKNEDQKSHSGTDTEDGKQLWGFKVVHVFDVSQTEGEDLPEIAAVQGTPGEHLAKMRALIQKHGITLEYEEIPNGADGMSSGGLITIRPDLAEAEEFAVLAHELAHELMHKGERRKKLSKTVCETEAEAVAFVVSQAIGLDCSSAASDYIQLYRGDKETLTESLDHIQKTSASIIESLKSVA